MKIEHFGVRNEFLRKYLDFYYLLSTVGDAKDTTYMAFPSGNCPLGFFKNASFDEFPDQIKVHFSPGDSVQTALVGNFLKPLEITFEPNIVEFSVVFKPLGINFFIKENLGKSLSQTILRTNYFAEFIPIVGKIMKGAAALDEFEENLAARFVTNKQLKNLETIIAQFQNSENQPAEKQISADLNISPKQFFRLFKNHLGVNPTQYRQLLRFRNALDLSLKNLRNRNLTEVGHAAGYYDQPHFIKEFKKITNLAPRDFLSKISLEANDRIVWQFFSELSDSYNQEPNRSVMMFADDQK